MVVRPPQCLRGRPLFAVLMRLSSRKPSRSEPWCPCRALPSGRETRDGSRAPALPVVTEAAVPGLVFAHDDEATVRCDARSSEKSWTTRHAVAKEQPARRATSATPSSRARSTPGF